MSEAPVFTDAQLAIMQNAIATAVTAALSQAKEATPVTPDPGVRTTRSVSLVRQSRALTADLAPSTDYYLPVITPDIPAVDPSKVKYPKLAFSDHKGDVATMWKAKEAVRELYAHRDPDLALQ